MNLEAFMIGGHVTHRNLGDDVSRGLSHRMHRMHAGAQYASIVRGSRNSRFSHRFTSLLLLLIPSKGYMLDLLFA
jgi:hypothetical protein